MRSNYWSCTKCADWVRGTPKIHSGTEREWRAWENIAKKKKVRYWLAEEGLDHLQRIINWPRNRLQDVRHYIDNRWITKTHALTSNLKNSSACSSLFFCLLYDCIVELGTSSNSAASLADFFLLGEIL